MAAIAGQSYLAKVRQAFDDEGTFATTLVAILLDLFGTMEFMEWDPETIALEYHAHTGGNWRKVPQVVRDKVAVMLGAYVSNNFFQSLETFIATCNALSGTPIDVRTFDPATIEEAAWAVTEIKLAGFEEEFHPEIAAYLGVQATEEGLESLPAVLSWADAPKSSGKSGEAAAEGGAELFAASYSQNRDDVADIEREMKRRTSAMLRELAEFHFRNREAEDA